jgi:hypothetical protein
MLGLNLITPITDDTGNCYAASLATITRIPFDELKGDVDLRTTNMTPKEMREWWRSFEEGLKWKLFEYGWVIAYMGTNIPEGLSIATGKSPRGDFDHCWVAMNGEPLFDPHPSRSFTDEVFYFEALIRVRGRVKGRD